MSQYHNHFQWLSGLFSAALCAVLCLWLFEKHKGLCGLCFFPEWCEKKKSFPPLSEQENLLWVFDSGLSWHCNISKSKAHLMLQQESPCCTSAPASRERWKPNWQRASLGKIGFMLWLCCTRRKFPPKRCYFWKGSLVGALLLTLTSICFSLVLK